MWKEIAVILGVCLVLVSARTSCTGDTECGKGECCYYHEGPMIMSRKRQLAQMSLPQDLMMMHQGGYCERYKLVNETCSVFGKINGHCECSPGLSCQFVSSGPSILSPDAIVASKRGMVYQGPGSYLCVQH
ncbi:uncharacterized protein LOC110454148 [Mizuhopecten yessoensis]|uniref:Uncharacterized protein n=1 Tax=Mizuhopecten yessoensis TaxID=6573 RepID=A0A210QFU0_MIZYE|nr:uncharacterized protein LOC110454148 [Mizuhopecten yessoensis]OWF47612.1 hypothetical protein KP79_PYT05678 [Mizuhopecten yessoensis]